MKAQLDDVEMLAGSSVSTWSRKLIHWHEKGWKSWLQIIAGTL